MRAICNYLVASVLLLLAGAVSGFAQEQVARVEVFVGYAYIRADTSQRPVDLNGWTVSLEGNLNPVLALVADFDGAYGNQLDERVSSHSALFGPRFMARPNWMEPFAHALFGVVRDLEAGDVQFGFGMTLGGGLDYDVNRRISLRLAQADYEHSRVSEFKHNNFRFAAGVVLKFGELK